MSARWGGRGSAGNPCDHTDVDRGHKFCRCSVCGVVARCTPTNDFYAVPDVAPTELRCETCVARGLPVVDMRPMFRSSGPTGEPS